MRYDKLTIKSQEALAEAQSNASSRGHSEIQPAHLLRALLAQPEGSTVPVLQKLGVSIERLQGDLERVLGALPKVSGGAQSQLSRTTSRVLEAAFAEAAPRHRKRNRADNSSIPPCFQALKRRRGSRDQFDPAGSARQEYLSRRTCQPRYRQWNIQPWRVPQVYR